MITTVMLFFALFSIQGFFNPRMPEEMVSADVDAAAQRLAEKLISTLQRDNADYLTLCATSEMFTDLMANSAELYGGHVTEAKRDFVMRYENNVLPAIRDMVRSIRDDGKRKGIDWKNVKISKVSLNEENGYHLTLQLDSNGTAFRIVLEKILLFDGEFKITQYGELI